MKENKFSNRLQEITIFFVTVIVSGVASMLYGQTIYDTIKLLICIVIASGTTIFVIETSKMEGTLLFGSEEHFHRFTLLYGVFLLSSVIFPLLPSGGWPFLVIYVSLMLFGNRLIAICSASTLLMISVMLTGTEEVTVFLLYFLCGVVGVILFSTLNENFKVGLPLLITLGMQFLCLCVQEVLMVNEAIHIQMFMFPMCNVMICLILLLIILKYFSFSIIYKTRDLYMDINDPECPLLVKLKEHSKEEYYHAIHTAYLCDRIAKKLDLDDAVAKAGGYYHKIGVLKGESNWENAKLVLEEYQYPENVNRILKEYLDNNERIILKETVVLLIADTVISSITYLFQKDSKAQLDYDKLIQAVFKKKAESGLFNYSMISLGELEEMKKILSEEKLYYDFLR